MQYASPELIVIGRAEVVVLGAEQGENDNPCTLTQPPVGFVLGLDD